MLRGYFSDIAATYDSADQAETAAGERLLSMMALGPNDFVLDIGCGPGNLTKAVRQHARGKLVGVDFATRMIARARWHASQGDISFQVMDATEMPFERGFNVAIMNSVLHWLADPYKVLESAFNALRRGGWFGLQTPYGRDWDSLMSLIGDRLKHDPETAPIWQRRQDPLFLMAGPDDYARMLHDACFDIHDQMTEEEAHHLSPEAAWAHVEIQLGPALFSPAIYKGKLSENELTKLKLVARAAIDSAITQEDYVPLVIQRLYVLASKQWNERRLYPSQN